MGTPETAQIRSAAWTLNAYLAAVLLTPDDAPEKAYFMQKLNNWIAYEDGVQNNTSSRFYQPYSGQFNVATEMSPWGLGRGNMKGVTNSTSWPNPLGLPPNYAPCNSAERLDTTIIPNGYYCNRPYMWFYVHVVGWLDASGRDRCVGTSRGDGPISGYQLLDPTACFFCASNYNIGIKSGEASVLAAQPVLTATIDFGTRTIPVDKVPIDLQSPPYVVGIEGEYVKICAADPMTLILTACPGGFGNGRAMWSVNSSGHAAGASVRTLQYFQTWGALKTGWTTPYATAFDWSGGGDSIGIELLAASSMYADMTVGGTPAWMPTMPCRANGPRTLRRWRLRTTTQSSPFSPAHCRHRRS